MTLAIKDGTGTTKNLSSYIDGSSEHNPRHSIITDEGAGATIGTTADAAATAGGVGSLSAKLRYITNALNTLISSNSGVESNTSASSIVEGSIGDSAVITNTTGTMNGKLRGIVGLLAAAIDITNGFIKAKITPFTSGGTSTYHLITAASTNANNIKNAAGQIYGWHIYNNAAYPIYVKLFDKASAPTVGSDTPIKTIGIPAGGGNNFHTDIGIPCASGISICVIKDITIAGTTAVALSDASVNVDYK